MAEGLRYNEGKTRHDLVPVYAQEQYARVLTVGANKYAERNWERGMAWSKTLASLKRHILAFERGDDFDAETGLLHMAHAMCNAAFLVEYYRIYPQGDDRPIRKMPRIGLDIDGVLADFVGGMMKRFPQMTKRASYWNDVDIRNGFMEISGDEDFWMGLEPMCDPKSLPFEPCCYVTSRPIDVSVSAKWLALHGFPFAPLTSLGVSESKFGTLMSHSVDIFVDDKYDTFVELNERGLCCYLMTAPYNSKYNVGHKRIYSLNEIIK